jgi:Universal stress protein family
MEARHGFHVASLDWCRPLRDAGVRYRAVLADTDPVHAILDTARREGADFIVLGTDGKTGLFHRLLGGLSDQLLHHAWRPIVAIPFHPDTVARSGPSEVLPCRAGASSPGRIASKICPDAAE